MWPDGPAKKGVGLVTTTAVRPQEAGVTVGSFFVSSWGYDQTNVDFYKVVGLTPKGVRVQEWSLAEESDDQHGSTRVTVGGQPRQVVVWPDVSQEELNACAYCVCFSVSNYGGAHVYAAADCEEHGSRTVDAPVKTKRLQSYDGGRSVYFALTSYSAAQPWEGRSMHMTASGWGH